MEFISSVQNKKIRDAVRLHSSRGRKQQKRIIIFGAREIQRAVASGIQLELLFVASDSDVPGGLNTGSFESIRVTDEVFQKLAYGNRNDGIIAVAKRPPTSLDQFRPNDGLILVAESIEKPGNLGAMFRTADATATGGIIVADPICDIFHPNAIRNSTGTAFSMSAAVSTNHQAIDWLRTNEYRILLATPEDANDLFDTNLDRRCAVVVGNEANGLSKTWMQGNYGRLKLPMSGAADSLNVSVTAAVIMYEGLRQKR